MEVNSRFRQSRGNDIFHRIAWARIDVKRNGLQESLVVIPAVYETKVVAPDEEREVILRIEQAQCPYASYRIVRKR